MNQMWSVSDCFFYAWGHYLADDETACREWLWAGVSLLLRQKKEVGHA